MRYRRAHAYGVHGVNRRSSGWLPRSLGVAIVVVCISGGLLSAGAVGALPSDCSRSGITVTCSYTSGTNAFVVPSGVTTVHVVGIGGSGGSTLSVLGGHGARVSA